MNVNEIKEALNKARTPYVRSEETGDLLDNTGETVADFIYHEEDAHLIANAPEWLASLVAEVERINGFQESDVATVRSALAETNQLRRQLEEMQKTLTDIQSRCAENSSIWAMAERTLQSLKGAQP